MKDDIYAVLAQVIINQPRPEARKVAKSAALSYGYGKKNNV